MTDITEGLVQEVWHELTAESPAGIDARLDRFRCSQPILAGYVRAVEEGVFARDDRGQMLFFALLAYEVCWRAGRARREIDEATIEKMLAENERLLAAVEDAPAHDVMTAASPWTESYPHLPLLAAILNHAMHGEMENVRRVDDFLGLLALHAKTTIDCLALG